MVDIQKNKKISRDKIIDRLEEAEEKKTPLQDAMDFSEPTEDWQEPITPPKWTKNKGIPFRRRKHLLIEQLERNPSMRKACAFAGIKHPSLVYKKMRKDAKLKEEILDAQKIGMKAVEDYVVERAMQNDNMAKFVLTHRHPRYKPPTDPRLSVNINQTNNIEADVIEADLGREGLFHSICERVGHDIKVIDAKPRIPARLAGDSEDGKDVERQEDAPGDDQESAGTVEGNQAGERSQSGSVD